MSADNPILNNPYEEPVYHYATSPEGELDYSTPVPGRRIFTLDPHVIPVRQGLQKGIWEINDLSDEFTGHLINLVRREVGEWRKAGYPANSVTRVTKELLSFWFGNPERHPQVSLFFAQREAIETAIWLNEVAPKSNAGQHVLSVLQDSRSDHMAHGGPESILPRIAFKMATGTGKTVVMAALILYHFFNRQEYRQDTRFADYFLLVTPGVTIRDRLSVLLPNESHDPETQDYYHARWLVPRNREQMLSNLNARIVITNYHAFEPKTLQGNKRGCTDGKIGPDGKKQEAKEDYTQVLKRLLGKFKPDSRLLVINDEAHHCYLPKEKGKAVEGEDTKEENARAAVWFRGLVEIAKRYKVSAMYDLSATPYYLTGSGFEPYSLFPWAVSDFGLIEAIESGLVKIPFLPESDETHELTMPVLRNIYEHVKGDLSRKGERTLKAEAKKAGKQPTEEPPNLPSLVRLALEQFYKHYRDSYDKIRGLYEHPPVFIVVCNNTAISKEVYKYLAGYERTVGEDETQPVAGVYDLFTNYDRTTLQPVAKPPTLLIDSDALENSDQVNDDFKKVFAREIELFKRDYVRIHGQGSVDKVTDGHILREVVNTVGKTGMLGAHIRCVVSVSMLTEGWDANTVTHIMGLRAFNSQLLCEQVAGRALRRQVYELKGYDKDGQPTEDKRRIVTWKFPPEYAHIIGIPFKTFKGGETGGTEPGETTKIYAVPERQEEHEITFPNVIGYRIEHKDGPIMADFSELEMFELDGTKFPLETYMATAFSKEKDKLTVMERIQSLRDQQVIYLITREMLSQYRGEDNMPEFHRFGQMRNVVEHWYHSRVNVIGYKGDEYRHLLYYEDMPKVRSHISRAIMGAGMPEDVILPVLNYYNSFGSTKYVRGATRKNVYFTQKSHVNAVVADTETWEQIAAKSLEELDSVLTYVKNAYLGFVIPYVDKNGEDRLYYPDFIARCSTPEGKTVNLIIEITGMNQDKVEKRWYVENRWLPAVNAVREKYEYDEWRFVEVANDIRDIKSTILAALGEG